MIHRVLAALWVMLLSATAFAADRPNILFAIADDASYPYMGAYGCSWVKTPAFDRVARQGILFNNAYTPNAKCAPSRACILTGRNSWQLEEAANHVPYFPAKFKTYAEALAEHGYHVGYTGKGWAPGIAKTADGKPRNLLVKNFSKKTAKPPTTGISKNDYAANFNDFLDAADKDQPWCFWYGSTEPHRGYEYGTGIKLAGKKISDIDKVPPFWPDKPTVRTDMLDYAYEVEHFDQHLGRMIAELEKRGMLDNTIIVVTADNGMPFPRIKGQEYEMSNHLPLAIMWPAGIRNPGRAVDDYVSFIDFAPTFITIAGLNWNDTGMHPTPGRPLTDIFNSNKAGRVTYDRDHVLIGKERHDIGRPNDAGYPIRGIVKDGWLYLHNYETDRWPAGDPKTGYLNCDGSPTKTVILDLRRSGEDPRFWQSNFGKRPAEQLYQVSQDRFCTDNVSSSVPDRREALRTQMVDELKAQGDPRMNGQGYIFDEYPYANKGQQHFYEKFSEGKLTPNNAGWVNPSDFETKPVE